MWVKFDGKLETGSVDAVTAGDGVRHLGVRIHLATQ